MKLPRAGKGGSWPFYLPHPGEPSASHSPAACLPGLTVNKTWEISKRNNNSYPFGFLFAGEGACTWLQFPSTPIFPTGGGLLRYALIFFFVGGHHPLSRPQSRTRAGLATQQHQGSLWIKKQERLSNTSSHTLSKIQNIKPWQEKGKKEKPREQPYLNKGIVPSARELATRRLYTFYHGLTGNLHTSL